MDHSTQVTNSKRTAQLVSSKASKQVCPTFLAIASVTLLAALQSVLIHSPIGCVPRVSTGKGATW